MAVKTATIKKRITTALLLGSFFSTPVLGNVHVQIPLYEKGSDVFYLQGTLDGYGETEFMLDTGSGPMALSSDILDTLRKQGKASPSGQGMAMLANGQQKLFSLYKISALQLGAECELKDIEAAELPAGTRNIIGINALKKTAPFSIHTSPAKLSLGGCTLADAASSAARL